MYNIQNMTGKIGVMWQGLLQQELLSFCLFTTNVKKTKIDTYPRLAVHNEPGTALCAVNLTLIVQI